MGGGVNIRVKRLIKANEGGSTGGGIGRETGKLMISTSPKASKSHAATTPTFYDTIGTCPVALGMQVESNTTLGPKVCKYYLRWAMWILRVRDLVTKKELREYFCSDTSLNPKPKQITKQ